ncbi:Uncharacterised protein [Mycobacteroides abscessus subsp. abscessus]|nr:Uncharacterised protein [Mycobacteroides abscessus subsp. abscessus]SLG85528.1 Uncharacterised protein [Mycobacteroides abscessus subsp. abscessus]
MLTGQVAVYEGANHVVVRHTGQVTRGIQTRHRSAGMFVHPYSRGGMPTAQTNLGDVHLDIVRTIVVSTIGMKSSAGRPLSGMQDIFQRRQRLLGQMGDFQIDRAPRRLDFILDLRHHLA